MKLCLRRNPGILYKTLKVIDYVLIFVTVPLLFLSIILDKNLTMLIAFSLSLLIIFLIIGKKDWIKCQKKN